MAFSSTEMLDAIQKLLDRLIQDQLVRIGWKNKTNIQLLHLGMTPCHYADRYRFSVVFRFPTTPPKEYKHRTSTSNVYNGFFTPSLQEGQLAVDVEGMWLAQAASYGGTIESQERFLDVISRYTKDMAAGIVEEVMKFHNTTLNAEYRLSMEARHKLLNELCSHPALCDPLDPNMSLDDLESIQRELEMAVTIDGIKIKSPAEIFYNPPRLRRPLGRSKAPWKF